MELAEVRELSAVLNAMSLLSWPGLSTPDSKLWLLPVAVCGWSDWLGETTDCLALSVSAGRLRPTMTALTGVVAIATGVPTVVVVPAVGVIPAALVAVGGHAIVGWILAAAGSEGEARAATKPLQNEESPAGCL